MGLNNQISTVTITLGQLKNTCFVIMPFNPAFDRVYEKVFKPAIGNANLTPIRGDEKIYQRRIMTDIWEFIRTSRCIIVDLTGKNLNVFYELGLSHALGKPVIIVTSDINDVPFDLRDLRCIVYDKNQPDWGELLKEDIVRTIKNVLDCHNPSDLLKDIQVNSFFPKLVNNPISEVPMSNYNLEGDWTIEETYDFGKTTGVAQFFQKGIEISGNMIITDQPNGEEVFVIRQSISGFIKDNEIHISGTSYQVIKGDIDDYQLDQWKGIIEDSNTIKGTSFDSMGTKGKFKLKRTRTGVNARG